MTMVEQNQHHIKPYVRHTFCLLSLQMMCLTFTARTMTRFVSLLLLCSIALSRSYVIKPGTWKFRNHPIAFETAKSVATETTKEKDPTPVLLLNGFGVGSFHQHRLIHELLGDDDHVDRQIYCIDYLGQGGF